MPGDADVELSIVIASLDPGPVLLDALSTIEPQRSSRIEIIVADASSDDTANRVRARFPWVRVIDAAPARSLPRLRGAGMAEAKAPLVGILDAWCFVGDTWVRDAIRAHREHPNLVIGGGVDLDHGEQESLTAWATYLFDYWEFVAPFPVGDTPVLPGNNITYKRAALADAGTLRAQGFWKAFTNARLQASGHGLRASAGLTVRLRRRTPLLSFLRSRFHHGRSYAAMRVGGAALTTRMKYAAITPVLPLVFFLRQARGLAHKPPARRWFALCAPVMLAFHVSWAFGELCGYLAGPGRSDDAIRS